MTVLTREPCHVTLLKRFTHQLYTLPSCQLKFLFSPTQPEIKSPHMSFFSYKTKLSFIRCWYQAFMCRVNKCCDHETGLALRYSRLHKHTDDLISSLSLGPVGDQDATTDQF